jgi:hypothetical protein
VSSSLTIHQFNIQLQLDMNYRQKKKFFQNFNLNNLQNSSDFQVFFQAKSFNSLDRIFLNKEISKLNIKVTLYQAKLLRQRNYIFENKFSQNVYSGLILVANSNYSVSTIKNFLLLTSKFNFLFPVFGIFLQKLCFNNYLRNTFEVTSVNLTLILLISHLQRLIYILKIKS